MEPEQQQEEEDEDMQVCPALHLCRSMTTLEIRAQAAFGTTSRGWSPSAALTKRQNTGGWHSVSLPSSGVISYSLGPPALGAAAAIPQQHDCAVKIGGHHSVSSFARVSCVCAQG